MDFQIIYNDNIKSFDLTSLLNEKLPYEENNKKFGLHKFGADSTESKFF